MPDVYGNPTPQELVTPTLMPSLGTPLTPQQQQDFFNRMNAAVMSQVGTFTPGAGGISPAVAAANEQFRLAQLPMIQNQMQLMGLADSPAMANAIAQGQAAFLTPVLQQGLSLQLQAAGMLPQQQQLQQALSGQLGTQQLGAVGALQGEEQLAQNAASLSANIAGQQQQSQLAAFNAAANNLATLGNMYGTAGQMQTGQQDAALGAMGTAGDLQQGTQQTALDASYQDFLRQMGLSEEASFGLFSTLFPSMATSVTKSSQDGKG